MLPLHFENRSRRGVAQPGLEYSSGGRVVASSNLVTPTLIIKDLHESVSPFFIVFYLFSTFLLVLICQKIQLITIDI